jgi:hypothetical protein
MLNLTLFATPETTNFMIAGYIVIFGVMAIYIASLFLRRRKFEQDIQILQELDDKSDKS